MSLFLHNITYTYSAAGSPALQDFSYTFLPGCFYGIFGANGSGKSTLLKLLAGDLPCGDTPELDGTLLRKLSPRNRARLLAYAAQGDELILPFTVRGAIRLGRYAWNDNSDDVADELLQYWQLEHLADKMFAELSGGERQKIKLLRILAQDTKYILLDEPGSSLDIPSQLELYKKLQDIAHLQKKCIIMVCHDLYTAPSFIDEMLLLKKGRLVYAGKVDHPGASAAFSQTFECDFKIERSSNSLTLSW